MCFDWALVRSAEGVVIQVDWNGEADFDIGSVDPFDKGLDLVDSLDKGLDLVDSLDKDLGLIDLLDRASTIDDLWVVAADRVGLETFLTHPPTNPQERCHKLILMMI